MKAQWPHPTLNHTDLRRDARSLDEHTRNAHALPACRAE
jgi:hypothetical protein